jgi:hypothetical protein
MPASWSEICAVVAGGLLIVAGLWLLRWRGGRGRSPTRVALGLSILFLGYHIAAWFGPAAWFWLSVPIAFWPAVAGGCVAVVGGSIGIDRLERRLSDRPGETLDSA